MTLIEFHFNAPDRLQYVCRLLRKATLQGVRSGVVGAEATLRQLDAALWKFSDVAFLPHCTSSDTHALKLASPIWLDADPVPLAGLDVLINLGEDVPQGFEKFERLIEIVAGDDYEKMMARKRWRHYVDQGYDLKQHDLSKINKA